MTTQTSSPENRALEEAQDLFLPLNPRLVTLVRDTWKKPRFLEKEDRDDIKNTLKALPLKEKLQYGTMCGLFMLHAGYVYAGVALISKWQIMRGKMADPFSPENVERRIAEDIRSMLLTLSRRPGEDGGRGCVLSGSEGLTPHVERDILDRFPVAPENEKELLALFREELERLADAPDLALPSYVRLVHDEEGRLHVTNTSSSDPDPEIEPLAQKAVWEPLLKPHDIRPL